MTSLKIESLSYQYENGKQIFNDLNIHAESGEFVVLIGPSGCGKSTLLRLISGLEKPDKGSIHFGSENVTALPARKRNISMVFQSYALYPHLNVAQNLELSLKVAKVDSAERKKRVNHVCHFLEIESLLKRKPAELSGGQRQRVAMGRALVREPAMFLFDEPLSNLDAELRARLRIQIKKLHQEFPATKVYVTHDQVEAMTLADRIVILKDGVVQQVGSPTTLYQNPANLFVAQFLGSPAINLLPMQRDTNGFTLAGKSLEVPRWSASGNSGQADFKMGVRPENTVLIPPNQAESGMVNGEEAYCIEGRLSVKENLGSVIQYNIESEFGDLRVTERNDVFKEGDLVTVGLPVKDAHLFDSASEMAVP